MIASPKAKKLPGYPTGEEPLTKNINPKGAILQRDKETYAIVPRIPGGLTSFENLREMTNVIEKYKSRS